MRDTYSGAAHVVVRYSQLRATLVPAEPDDKALAELYIRIVSWENGVLDFRDYRRVSGKTLSVGFANLMLELTNADI